MITAAVIVGWLLIGLTTARVTYVTELTERLASEEMDPFLAVTMTVFWPLLWAILLVYGAGQGAYRLVTLPTRQERMERRRLQAREQQREVERLERKYGL